MMLQIPKDLMEETFVWGLPDPNNSSENPSNQQKTDDANIKMENHIDGNQIDENVHGDVDGDVKEEGESSYAIHIWTERERRKKMRDMFTILHSLLPNIPPKVDKATVVDEAISYIKTLEQNLNKLEKQKREKLKSMDSREYILADEGSSSTFTNNNALPSPLISTARNALVGFNIWTAPNLTLSICEGEAYFTVCWPKTRSEGFTNICFVLEKYNLVVVSAHLSSDFNKSTCMIQARAYGYGQVIGAFEVAEVFKQAAIEILGHLSS